MATDPQPSSEAPETSQPDQDPENPSPESSPEESPESEGQEESPADEGEGEKPEASEEEGEGEPPPAAANPDEKHKRAGGFQRKIERLERQNQILLEQLQRGGPSSQTAQPPAKKTPEEEALAQFEKLVDDRVAQRESAQQAKAQVQAFQARTREVREKYDDFDDLVSMVDIPTGSALGQAILTSEQGPEIMYKLASNPAELARLRALSPFEAAREIGRLEAKASGSGTQKPKSANRPPAPPSKVGGTAKSTRSLDDLPISEYKRAIRSGRR